MTDSIKGSDMTKYYKTKCPCGKVFEIKKDQTKSRLQAKYFINIQHFKEEKFYHLLNEYALETKDE